MKHQTKFELKSILKLNFLTLLGAENNLLIDSLLILRVRQSVRCTYGRTARSYQ
ncbi:MAG: hypothetical protein M1470_09800 [Bacteroidetes bacterium]|nr:hypothetical protein [Bacteroidota bacterium]